MDCAVDATAAEERGISCIYDGVEFEEGDVVADESDLGVVGVVYWVRGGGVRLETVEFVEEWDGGDLGDGDERRHRAGFGGLSHSCKYAYICWVWEWWHRKKCEEGGLIFAN